MFQGFLFNALELNHACLSQGCTRQRRGQMEPSSPPCHTWAGASLSTVPRGRWQHGGSPLSALCQALTNPRAAAEANGPSIVQPGSRASLRSLQHLNYCRDTVQPLRSPDAFPFCRQPLSGEAAATRPASGHAACHGRAPGRLPREHAVPTLPKQHRLLPSCCPGKELQVPSRMLQKVQPAAGRTSEATRCE